MDAIHPSDLDGGNPVSLLDNLNSTYGLAIDPINDHLYYTDYLAGSIKRADLGAEISASNAITILSGLVTPGLGNRRRTGPSIPAIRQCRCGRFRHALERQPGWIQPNPSLEYPRSEVRNINLYVRLPWIYWD